MNNNWVAYQNGNYEVLLNLSNGTKIRYNEEDSLIPDRPESMDVKITNKCSHGCLFCHENSITNGKSARKETLKKFAESVLPYTELAVAGGNLIEDVETTEYFLKLLKESKVIPSITLQQEDFIKYNDIVKKWVGNSFIYGIGVSVDNPKDRKLHNLLSLYPNAVIHTIAGLYDKSYFEPLYDKEYKVLILGFKQFRRGQKYYMAMQNNIDSNMQWLSDNVKEMSEHFKVISFDNLAIEQLDMGNKVSKQVWDKYYCGDDGNYTFYVDLVEECFAKNSTSIARFPIDNKTPVEMFEEIRSLYAKH